jgi:hypothetical protein
MVHKNADEKEIWEKKCPEMFDAKAHKNADEKEIWEKKCPEMFDAKAAKIVCWCGIDTAKKKLFVAT